MYVYYSRLYLDLLKHKMKTDRTREERRDEKTSHQDELIDSALFESL